MISKEEIARWFMSLQDSICTEITQTDGNGHFHEDAWNRPEGGGGRTRIFREGNVLEKAGVNFSSVHGPTPDKILQALKLQEADFFATGVSIVMHPFNPHVPIIHMNVRYFEMTDGTWWFGGGIDLTPHFVQPEQASHFHTLLKEVCDSHDTTYYPKFKTWADDYFYLKHRKETRGIGGIFFDRLSGPQEDREKLFEFVKDVGSAFTKLYCPLMDKNHTLPVSEAEKEWQYVRRSRYVEFNLLYDKGTKFGLDTDGRVESILMSMPPQANWHYNLAPEAGTQEATTLSLLKKDIDWIHYDA